MGEHLIFINRSFSVQRFSGTEQETCDWNCPLSCCNVILEFRSASISVNVHK